MTLFRAATVEVFPSLFQTQRQRLLQAFMQEFEFDDDFLNLTLILQ